MVAGTQGIFQPSSVSCKQLEVQIRAVNLSVVLRGILLLSVVLVAKGRPTSFRQGCDASIQTSAIFVPARHRAREGRSNPDADREVNRLPVDSIISSGGGGLRGGRGGGLHGGGGVGFQGRGSHGTASMDEASTEEDSTDQASLDSGLMTATGTVMDILTGTESLPVMTRALSFASV